MVNKLRENIFQLAELLRKRNNGAAIFFEELCDQLDKGNVLDVVKSIIHSYAITQYANFDCKEESLFSEIWNTAAQLNDKSIT